MGTVQDQGAKAGVKGLEPGVVSEDRDPGQGGGGEWWQEV